MDIAYRRPLRIAIVVTRDLSESNGRTPILSHIVRALSAHHETELLYLRAVVESPNLRDIAGALLAWLASVLRGHPLPLQCVLYASPWRCRQIVARIRESGCDAVYLDTVRCQMVLRLLRKTLPALHIVTDFDDLMSRRARYLFQNRLPFAAGHVGRHFPSWLRLMAEALLARPIVGYEALTLPLTEDDVVAASDATVLLSSADRDILHARTPAETLHTIPPAIAVMRPPQEGVSPRRFVFIGSDSFIQNRTAIDFLLDTWCRYRPPLELHIYGRQSRTPVRVAGVHWRGFAADLAEVYEPGSIALVPALDRGGIKTKVLEAWAWGCPVLGNLSAVEGLGIEDYPLALPEVDWPAFLTAPLEQGATWARAARTGYDFVHDHLSAQRFEWSWDAIMHPDALKPMPLMTRLAFVPPMRTDPPRFLGLPEPPSGPP
jgi:glycosyltransferase involved in cell wall biosynthesis